MWSQFGLFYAIVLSFALILALCTAANWILRRLKHAPLQLMLAVLIALCFAAALGVHPR